MNNRNRLTDIENKPVVTSRERESGEGQDTGSNQKVHQQMGGQRRTPPCTDGIFASEKNETMPFAAP